MKRATKLCKKAGCPNLATTDNGYCQNHDHKKFDDLTAKKEEWKKKFYSSWKWRKKSLDHRRKEPFCRRCLPRKVVGDLVHHNPELSELVEEGLDPFDDQYLETLCHEHHQVELNRKKYVNNEYPNWSILR